MQTTQNAKAYIVITPSPTHCQISLVSHRIVVKAAVMRVRRAQCLESELMRILEELSDPSLNRFGCVGRIEYLGYDCESD